MRHASWLLALLPLLACGEPEPSSPPEPLVEPAPAPAPPSLRRLTVAQYHNALVDLLGPDIVLPTSLEPDTAVDGLHSIGAAVTSVSPRGIEQYEQAAYALAAQALADHPDREAFVGCAPADVVDPACAEAFLSRFARLAWRRPAADPEIAALVGIAGEAAQVLGDFHQGLEFALAGVLQSPSFLYREELGAPAQAGRRLTDLELATRLSFLFWNSIPDEELLDAAEAGELSDPTGVEAQARRMLEDPRASRGIRAFASEWLELYALDDLSKDPTVFPHFTSDLGRSAKEETLRVIEELVATESDFRDLLTTRDTWVDRNLAMIYDVPAPERDGFGPLTLPSRGDRLGYLGSVSFLALHAHPVSTSATLRGKFVREALLCQSIPPPPADLNTAIPEPSENARTMRERVAVHLENAFCAGCHAMTDPIGLGVEQFDGIGRWRTQENGAPIDPGGDLDGHGFRSLPGLAVAVRNHPDLGPCIAETVFSWGVGHRPVGGEQGTADWLHAAFADSGYALGELLVTLAASEAFRTVGSIEE